MSSISRRHNGLMALSVIGAPVLGEVFAPRSQDRTPASATPRDPSLATDYRGSGLVLRRDPVVAARSGDGPFTIPFADLAHRVLLTGDFVEFTTLCPGKPPEGQLDGGDGNESGQGFGRVFEI